MKKYVGTKVVEATPMNKYEFYMNIKRVDCKEENAEGYMVIYKDGYVSWSPKNVFEEAYREYTNTVTQEQIKEIIDNAEIDVQTVLDKCTIVTCKLPNGFIIVESSACVDPANYDENLGAQICMERIVNKVWELEGYVLQTKQ